MFIILVLFCLASSYGQRPATDDIYSISSSQTLLDLEPSSILYSSEENGTMIFQQNNSSFVDRDTTYSSNEQYSDFLITSQYSYSSPVAIQSFTDTEKYSSINSYQSEESSAIQETIISSVLRSSLETPTTLESSTFSTQHEQNNGSKVLASVLVPATSSFQSSEVVRPSDDFVIGKSSKNKGHSVDDILGSIVHLLGPNVKIIRPETERESHEKAATPARKNDRGPPKIRPSETIFLRPTSVVTEVHHGSTYDSSSTSTIRKEYSSVVSESSSTVVDSVLITPSFSLVENEASDRSNIETTSPSLNMTLSFSFNPTEKTRIDELVTSTENILNLSLSTLLHDRSTKIQEAVQPNVKNSTKTTLEATEEPPIPTGPITDWVPLLDRSSLKRKPQSSVNNGSELLIFTEPSIFNFTVSNSIVGSTATTDPRIFPSELSTGSNFSSTATQPTESVSKIINAHPTRSSENSRPTVLSASSVNPHSTRNKKPETNVTHIPENSPEPQPPDYEDITKEAAEIDEVIVTLLGSGTLKSPPATTAPPNPGLAIGRPYVIPVDIEEVRPFIGGQLPTRPTSLGRPQVNGEHVQVAQAGINVADENGNKKGPSIPSGRPALVRPHRPRPTPPLIRIDTCIVGDDSTCDAKLNEYCKTDQGISSCQCRPGYSRTFPRGPCQAVIKMLMSIRLDRLGDQKLVFNRNYLDPGSQEYQQLEYETRQAINSLFSYTPFARTFMGSMVNKFYSLGRKVIANSTILLDESTQSPNLRQRIRYEVVKAIANRKNNLGESKLYVDESQNPIPSIEDLNECSDPNLNDCSSSGYCINAFATYRCACSPGFLDKYADEERRSGRVCTACTPEYCNNHGNCIINNGQRECKCRGNYIGAKCEIDGEVLGVALGASLAAMVIIVLTLVCLCVWNRRWKSEQYKADMTSVPSMGGYPNKTISPINTYRLTIEDRVRWAHIADAMGSNYATVERPGRSLPTKQEREESYYGHPGRPRSRLCLNGPQPNGYYSPDYPPREAYHPSPNRMITAGTVRPYYS